MTIFEMLGQSGTLTLLGMGVVFGFLVILVIAITGVGKLIHALKLDKDVAAPAGTAAPQPSGNNAAVTAAISAAVNEYQKTEGR